MEIHTELSKTNNIIYKHMSSSDIMTMIEMFIYGFYSNRERWNDRGFDLVLAEKERPQISLFADVVFNPRRLFT